MRQAIRRALSAAAAVGMISGLVSPVFASAAGDLKIGILGGLSVETGFAAQTCLMQELADGLGVPVTVNAFASGTALQDALVAGEVDLASLSPRSYSALWRSNAAAVQPVLAPLERGGAKGYRAVVLARTGAELSTLEDMTGKEVGFADHRSLPGYFVPSVALARDGFKTEGFAVVQFSGGHQANLTALESGAIDLAVTWTTVGGTADTGPLARFKPGAASPLSEIWRSPLVPNGPLVLRKTLPDPIKHIVTTQLAALGARAPDCLATAFGRPITGLFPVTHADYETFIEADHRRLSLSVASN
ncbi:phosphate/phosphite/phosphonate ABC transporter substrate-binding protein [Nisaea sp.]|uniref:phosphate/phosphite/phosphonate ABC transporter substrate-binding protein n=1 Tax=Nisaea sp. TaxID=2024842 RepID=UPI003B5277C8